MEVGLSERLWGGRKGMALYGIAFQISLSCLLDGGI